MDFFQHSPALEALITWIPNQCVKASTGIEKISVELNEDDTDCLIDAHFHQSEDNNSTFQSLPAWIIWEEVPQSRDYSGIPLPLVLDNKPE